MSSSSPQRLEVRLLPARLSAFYPLLQQGVKVPCEVGHPLGDLLSRQWGIDADYVAKRVTTIFLNARAIDDLATAIVTHEAVIALSGAMPGLVGATMRRGGYYAAMRGNLTHQPDDGGPRTAPGTIRLKLFNLLLPELSPGVLRRGILLRGEELLALQAGEAGFLAEAFLGDQAIAEEHLLYALAAAPQEEFLLTVLLKEA